MTMIVDAAYFELLWDRRDNAVLLEPRTVKFLNGDSPRAAECHENVNRWVKENPDDQAVIGWVIHNHGAWARFVRHSVALSRDGRLTDITLADPYNFLKHEGNQADLDRLAEQGNNEVCWPPILTDDLLSVDPGLVTTPALV